MPSERLIEILLNSFWKILLPGLTMTQCRQLKPTLPHTHTQKRTKNISNIYKKHLTRVSKNVALQLNINIDCEVHRWLTKIIFTH